MPRQLMNWSLRPTRRRSVLTAIVLLGLYASGMLNRDHEAAAPDDVQEGEPIEIDARELQVIEWRVDQLTKAGFDELRSNTLAVVGDWRRAIALVKDGCDHLTATDICI